MEDVMIIQSLVVIVHVLPLHNQPLPLWELTITVNQELSTIMIDQPITLMIHCGTDLIVTVVLTVALTLSYHGSTKIWVRVLQVI